MLKRARRLKRIPKFTVSPLLVSGFGLVLVDSVVVSVVDEVSDVEPEDSVDVVEVPDGGSVVPEFSAG
jgi:hypothetical protein